MSLAADGRSTVDRSEQTRDDPASAAGMARFAEQQMLDTFKSTWILTLGLRTLAHRN